MSLGVKVASFLMLGVSTIAPTVCDSPTRVVLEGTFGDGGARYQVNGRNLLWGGTLPTLTLTIGSFTFALDGGNNEIEPLTGDGQLVDVCEMIE